MRPYAATSDRALALEGYRREAPTSGTTALLHALKYDKLV
jgi:hypothetical protein